MTDRIAAKKRRAREREQKIAEETYVPPVRPTLRHPDGTPVSRSKRLARR